MLTTAWSWYVIALVASNIVACAWLLWWTARRRPGDPPPDQTSHVWDGDITEYNKPLPRWWINGFYLSIVFSIGYLLWYPGLGGLPGLGKWTSASQLKQDEERENVKLDETFRPYKGQPIDVLAKDPEAVRLGRAIFSNNCATCHGSSGQGANGFPNLTDDVWHWGGKPQQVLESVLNGREGVMPPWGSVLTGMSGENAVDYVVAYVRTLSDPSLRQNNFLAAQGKSLYEGVCVACHGIDGKGNPTLGAPDLTDDYWMYGDSTESLSKTIADGRHGVMPAWGPLLGETRSRLVAAYVWSLSHGQPDAPAERGGGR